MQSEIERDRARPDATPAGASPAAQRGELSSESASLNEAAAMSVVIAGSPQSRKPSAAPRRPQP